MSHARRLGRDSERGSALIMAVAVVTILFLAGMGLLHYTGTISGSYARVKRHDTAFFCAEAGLQHGRRAFGRRFSEWNTMLSNPGGVTDYPLVGDSDGDATNDYEVTIRDNEDEFGPGGNDPDQDNDLRVIVRSECTKPGFETDDEPVVIEAIIRFVAPETPYEMGGGNASQSGNYDET